jgi:hypothetical protein
MMLLSKHRPNISFSFLVQSLMCKHDDEWARLNPHIPATAQARGSSWLALGLLHATRILAANRAMNEVRGLLEDLRSIRELGTPGQHDSRRQYGSIKPNSERSILCVVLEQKTRF